MTNRTGPLLPYRGLDLTGETGMFCGKLLADLGADIIKIERPGGDPARLTGPFYGDTPDPEKSLSWCAFNATKRSIALDIETPEGREELKKLVGTADFFIESFSPGYLDRLGLGYAALSEINPGIIFTSITPFGQTGPYRDLNASDLVLWALGGMMNACGYADRAPLRMAVDQACLQAGLHGAVGTLLALHGRNRISRGQHVDVSAHEAVMRLGMSSPQWWFHTRMITGRSGNRQRMSPLVAPLVVWPCQDGEVMFSIYGGVLGRLVKRLVDWMNESGDAGHLMDIAWDELDVLKIVPEELERIERVFLAFFAKHTKQELADGALQRRFALAPVNSIADVARDAQLQSRGFLTEVDYPALGRSLLYPGAPFRFSATPCTKPAAAPRIGEHSAEIREELAARRTTGAAASGVGTRASPVGGDAAQRPGGPLAGVRILDFSRILAGPLSTTYLADFGADVIKVESLAAIDNVRTVGPYKDNLSTADSSFFGIMVNSSKRAMNLDLSKEKGREIARKLVAWADVVAENFGVGVMKSFGLDYEELRKINPSVIMISSSSFGQTGPLAKMIGFGVEQQGRGGFTYLTGWPDRVSVPPHNAYSDATAPWFSALALLAALDHRNRTGEGQYIDLAQHEVATTLLAVPLLAYSASGHVRGKQGNRASSAAPHGAYPCLGEDRWCAITVLTDQQWDAFRRALGNPDWSRDPRFGTLTARKANEDELDERIAEWTRKSTAEEVMETLQRAGVPAGVVKNDRDIVDFDPHVRERGFYRVLDKPGYGESLYFGWPVKLSRTPLVQHCGPSFGEHTEQICREILEMEGEEFVRLLDDEVLR